MNKRLAKATHTQFGMTYCKQHTGLDAPCCNGLADINGGGKTPLPVPEGHPSPLIMPNEYEALHDSPPDEGGITMDQQVNNKSAELENHAELRVGVPDTGPMRTSEPANELLNEGLKSLLPRNQQRVVATPVVQQTMQSHILLLCMSTQLR